MNVTIELRNGPNANKRVTQSNMQRSIDAVKRAKSENIRDEMLLIDVAGILRVIQNQLPH